LAAAGLAGMIGLSGAAGAADRPSDTQKQPIVATIVIDGEAKTLDLTPKGFDDVRDAERWLKTFLKDRGITDWQAKIERSPDSQGDGTGRYQRLRIMGAGGLESMQEGKFRKRDIEEKLISNDKLNDLKSKYLPDWEMLDHRILQAKYVAKDHRHAEEFVSYINKVSEKMDHFAEVTQDVAEVSVKTSTFDVKGLTILDFKLALEIDKFAERNDIEQVRMQGNFGMHEDIRKVKGGYRLVSKKTGRNLGTYPTRAEAIEREKQVQYFKHKGK
jgi:4a-hydroxytetrahydrobiopterin dehydratase